MPDYTGLKPIYQYYVDAQQSRARAQLEQQEVGIERIKGIMELYGLQQQIQEQQTVRQAWAQENQGQATPGVGGSQPNANPATGDDPSLRTAAVMDKIGQSLSRINPMKSAEWFTKASTIRDQYYGREQKQLQIQKAQTDQIAGLFGSLDPNDQAGYTDALGKLVQGGVDIKAFGLTGSLANDLSALQRIAKQSMTYSQKLEAKHRAFDEEMSLNKFHEQTRHDSADESIGWAKVGVAQAGENLRKSHNKFVEGYMSREETRKVAGVDRTDAMDLQKRKDAIMRPDPGGADEKYVKQTVDADAKLSQLSDNQKKAAVAEIQITARRNMADRIKKPTDPMPSADDFMDEIAKATANVAKRTSGGHKVFGIGPNAKMAPRTFPGAPPVGTQTKDPKGKTRTYKGGDPSDEASWE